MILALTFLSKWLLVIGVLSFCIACYFLYHIFDDQTNLDSEEIAILSVILAAIFAFLFSYTYPKLVLFLNAHSNVKTQEMQVNSTYRTLINEESSESEEIRNYRKQVIRENGKVILEQKAKIKNELDAKLKDVLKTYRKKLEEEYAKKYENSATNILVDVVKSSKKKFIERVKKNKEKANKFNLNDDSVIIIHTNGKKITIDKEGIH